MKLMFGFVPEAEFICAESGFLAHLFIFYTRTSARYARLVLAPAGGWGTVQTLLGANKYSCILIPNLSYPYIPIRTYNR